MQGFNSEIAYRQQADFAQNNTRSSSFHAHERSKVLLTATDPDLGCGVVQNNQTSPQETHPSCACQRPSCAEMRLCLIQQVRANAIIEKSLSAHYSFLVRAHAHRLREEQHMECVLEELRLEAANGVATANTQHAQRLKTSLFQVQSWFSENRIVMGYMEHDTKLIKTNLDTISNANASIRPLLLQLSQRGDLTCTVKDFFQPLARIDLTKPANDNRHGINENNQMQANVHTDESVNEDQDENALRWSDVAEACLQDENHATINLSSQSDGIQYPSDMGRQSAPQEPSLMQRAALDMRTVIYQMLCEKNAQGTQMGALINSAQLSPRERQALHDAYDFIKLLIQGKAIAPSRLCAFERRLEDVRQLWPRLSDACGAVLERVQATTTTTQ